MIATTGNTSGPNANSMAAASPRRRRWRRRLAVLGIVLLILLGLGYAGVATMLGDTEAPLALPTGTADAPAGALEGTWTADTRSVAGYRLGQTVLGLRGNVVARTTAVTGSATIENGVVTAGSFEIDLTTITAGGKVQPGLADVLGTASQPVATIALTAPVSFDAAFANGGTIERTAAGDLSMHGATNRVTITIQAQRNADAIEIAGAIPLRLADWGIRPPSGAGPLGELDDHGVAEFLLVLMPEGAGG